MATLTPPAKKTAKRDRERKVLIGLVEYYIKTGKPVGSNTLKEVGFGDLSSATIRNYFAHLDEEGYLTQQHSSGGRIPTDKAFRLYATECLTKAEQTSSKRKDFNFLRDTDTRAIATLLQQGAEQLAALTKTAVFLSAPRFDQDFITSIKLVPIDSSRCLCILITDFGEIKTEILYMDHKIGTISSKRIEAYFNWRLNGQDKPRGMSPSEEEIAQKLYNELLVRYVVGYSQFTTEDIYRTGFSTLLTHHEFHDPALLANSLALFENTHGMRLLLKDCSTHNTLRFWVGDDLSAFAPQASPDCTVIAIPYHVNKQPVGAIGILGPQRLYYPVLFEMLHHFSQRIGEALTRSLYKFKITFRAPNAETVSLKKQLLIAETRKPLLEDKRNTTPKTSKQTPRRKS